MHLKTGLPLAVPRSCAVCGTGLRSIWRLVQEIASLNYRHAFHAGNFADLMKHAILLQVIARLRREATPLVVVDTHAGAGLYDLGGEAAMRTGEAALGVRCLMSEADTPDALTPLRRAIEAVNLDRDLRYYPGSPRLIVDALRPQDRYVGCEVRPDDHDLLVRAVGPAAAAAGVQASILRRDGYLEAADRLRPLRPRLLLLIDPPYERGDDYDQVIQTLARLVDRPRTCALIWTPLKDLETFDAFLRRLAALGLADAAVAEVRLRPLTDPMRMNGCALVMIGPAIVVEPAQAICRWIAKRLGDVGATGDVCDLYGASLVKS